MQVPPDNGDLDRPLRQRGQVGNRALPPDASVVVFPARCGKPLRFALLFMSTAKRKIKVLLVDDHPVVRKGLLSCLSAQDHLKIVGEASNAPMRSSS